jgi:hypothetical protein
MPSLSGIKPDVKAAKVALAFNEATQSLSSDERLDVLAFAIGKMDLLPEYKMTILKAVTSLKHGSFRVRSS